MHSLRKIRLVMIAGALAAAASSSNAVVLLGDLPWTGGLGDGTAISGTTRTAVEFTTPATSYTVDSVVLNLSGYYGPPETLSLGFYSDSGALPGSVVGGVLNNPAGPGNDSSPATDYTFTTGSTVTLSANTSYWMVFYVPAGFVGWSWNPGGGDPTGLATFTSYHWSYDSGASYNNDNAAKLAFQINATAVPEPGTWTAIAGACALFVAGFARWRRTG